MLMETTASMRRLGMKSCVLLTVGLGAFALGCATQSTLQQSQTAGIRVGRPQAFRSAAEAKRTADDLFRQGKYEEAISAFDAAIRMDTDTSESRESRYGRGSALLRLDRNQEALKDFDFLINRRCDFPGLGGLGTNIRLSRAQAYIQMGELGKAIDDCTIAIDKTKEAWGSQRGSLDYGPIFRKNLIDAYSLRALAYSRQGDTAKSMEDEDNATKLKMQQK